MVILPASTLWSWWLKAMSHPKDDDYFTIAAITISLLVIPTLWYLWLLLIKSMKPSSKLSLPPGPSGLPLVGNLPFLDSDLHRCFADMARIHGPVMKIQMGQKLCVVVSSPSMAKEVLRDQDTRFADRDPPSTMETLSYGGNNIIWAPYGPEWRKLRKFCVEEMLSKSSLDAMYALRRREVQRTVREVYAMVGKPINIGEQVFLTMSSLIASMCWGVTLRGEERNRVGAEFGSMVLQVFELASKLNLKDLFPVIGVDVQGLRRKAKMLMSRMDAMFEYIIDMREKEIKNERDVEKWCCNDSGEAKDFLHSFLQREADGEFEGAITRTHLKALFQDMIVAGIDTSATTVDWAMGEMMNKPETMTRAQEELAEVVGMNNIVEEHHLPKLGYLNAVIKEALRLHPPGPFLVPRRTRNASILNGFTIPNGTQVLVNAWAIHRDPKNWANPSKFEPERFLGGNNTTKLDYNSNDFRYLPFGSGRRICVGVSLVERMVPHVLGSLLHSYNWKPADGTKLDLKETFMIVLKKATPTIAIAEPRLSSQELYAA